MKIFLEKKNTKENEKQNDLWYSTNAVAMYVLWHDNKEDAFSKMQWCP